MCSAPCKSRHRARCGRENITQGAIKALNSIWKALWAHSVCQLEEQPDEFCLWKEYYDGNEEGRVGGWKEGSLAR